MCTAIISCNKNLVFVCAYKGIVNIEVKVSKTVIQRYNNYGVHANHRKENRRNNIVTHKNGDKVQFRRMQAFSKVCYLFCKHE